MDARDPQQPRKKDEKVMNPADYVDALLRPQSQGYVVTQSKIKGRRMRDQYLGEVTVTKVAPRD
jgi:hypothetical protein